MIEIISYQNKYREDFKRLNLEWLDKYNLTESHDLLVLNDPESTVINNSGFIWLAKVNDEIVGTAAIANEGNGVFELIKMCVTEKWQGRGISRLLIETCIEKAKAIGVKKLELVSNHQLQTAVNLYEKYGFKHVEVADTRYATADVKMELSL